ncbi:anthrax toxin-like adenylyl cyclase domain-containing protein [Algicola sagamiensis]|uniref:anthrax toxin-like adenylyl cyclase domain-containing protein n=1 Tax=Algicola sagamiensis TaxID=163869 RepID=UPI00035F9895|nr:anthrax toxin-like adenylyl cyclase domain-containing protein [Algicola sagamiensis]
MHGINVKPSFNHQELNQVETARPTSTQSKHVSKFQDVQHIDKVGFPESHLKVMAQYAQEKNIIFGIRPVDAMNKTLLDEGYPTKDLTIKPKSSTWGPMAGFIPCDQAFSKLEAKKGSEKGQQAIENSNEKVKSCLKDKHAVSGQLVISKNRINELVSKSAGSIESTTTSQNQISLFVTSPSGEKFTFQAIESAKEHGKFSIFLDDEPFHVLCDKNSKLPITADYDLLLVAPNLSDYGAGDLAKGDPSQSVLESHLRNFNAPKETTQPKAPQGFISSRVKELGDDINARLDRELNKLIHHGADDKNPFTDKDANFPATFFLPEPINGFGTTVEGHQGAISVIEQNEMAAFIQSAKDQAFFVPVHNEWGQDVQNIKRGSFQESLDYFQKV